MNVSSMTTSPGFTLGPIPIPRRRQVAQNLHRLMSIKAGMRVVTCESGLEADAVFAEEGTPETTWLCEQPIRIDEPIGKKPFCTLDLARRRNGQETDFEIKPSNNLVEADDGRLKPANWDEIEKASRRIGRSVDFMTELDLEPKKLLIANWRTLLPFAVMAYRDPDDDLNAHILNLTSGGSGMSIRDVCLAEADRDDNTVKAHIAMLLHQGRLSAPLSDERVVPNTVLKGVEHEAP